MTRPRLLCGLTLSVALLLPAAGPAAALDTASAPRAASAPAVPAPAASVSTTAVSTTALSTTAAAPAVQLRVDQAGYLPGDRKTAYVLSPRALPDAVVDVVDRRGRRVARAHLVRRGAWSAAFPDVYSADFSRVTRTGRYHLVLPGTAVRSVAFPVLTRSELWDPVLRQGTAFDRVQRDGAGVVAGPLRRRPSHLDDATGQLYLWPDFEPDSDAITDADLTPSGGKVDVEGGWFDAGDYLKLTHSTAYADVLLYAAARSLGPAAPASLTAEARHGSDWLAKMWDARTRTLYLQVGIGSGNDAGTFTGDHDLWRLPERDDADHAGVDRYATAHRPVFRAAPPGRPISPNLAGRVSAAFALAAQADARTHPRRARAELADATSLYAMADTASPPVPLVTALPNAFYPEAGWHDDMELGAVEIARARLALHRPAQPYLGDAAHWARAYLRDDVHHGAGDTFNLYDVSALAHTDLVRTMRAVGATATGRPAVSRAALVADLRRQLTGAARRSAAEPFRAGVDDTQFDVDSHTLGLVATEGWYRSLTGDRRFDDLATSLRGWVFGANAWGVSFMVGVGTTYPHCMQHQVANLSGSTDGRAPLAVGAVVNGPNGAAQFDGGLGGRQDGMAACPAAGTTAAVPAGVYDGSGSVYLDDVRSWQTDEPALDMTGAAIIAAAAQLGLRGR